MPGRGPGHSIRNSVAAPAHGPYRQAAAPVATVSPMSTGVATSRPDGTFVITAPVGYRADSRGQSGAGYTRDQHSPNDQSCCVFAGEKECTCQSSDGL